MDNDLAGGAAGSPADSTDDSTDPGDLVRQTLADAQRSARRRPTRRRSRRTRASERDAPAGDERTTAGYTGPGADRHDPQPLGAVFDTHVGEQGWERPLSQARLFADWAGIVGSDVAAHCHPVGLRAGELRISAESTAWATQLRLLTNQLLQRLAADLGPDVVNRLVITGPSGPSWRHGAWSVRGARGPRDTYG